MRQYTKNSKYIPLFGGRPKTGYNGKLEERYMPIGRDDITNLKIALSTTTSLKEFFAATDGTITEYREKQRRYAEMARPGPNTKNDNMRNGFLKGIVDFPRPDL